MLKSYDEVLEDIENATSIDFSTEMRSLKEIKKVWQTRKKENLHYEKWGKYKPLKRTIISVLRGIFLLFCSKSQDICFVLDWNHKITSYIHIVK